MVRMERLHEHESHVRVEPFEVLVQILGERLDQRPREQRLQRLGRLGDRARCFRLGYLQILRPGARELRHPLQRSAPGALAVAGRARSGLVGLIPATPPQQHGSQQQQDRAFCDERRVGIAQVIEVVMADCHVGDVDHAERALRAFPTARPH